MAKMQCPKCGSAVAFENGWAKAALSTTIAAPAVPDMATQVRCQVCQSVFAQSDVIHQSTGWSRRTSVLVWVSIFAAIAWAIYQVAIM